MTIMVRTISTIIVEDNVASGSNMMLLLTVVATLCTGWEKGECVCGDDDAGDLGAKHQDLVDVGACSL